VSGRFGPVRLHEELVAILTEAGNRWMTTDELAREVQRRGRHRKQDGTSAVSDYQVHGRTKNYETVFERDGTRVRLRGARAANPVSPRSVPGARHAGRGRAGAAAARLDDVLAALRWPALAIEDAERTLADVAGLYAVYGAADVWQQLGLGHPPDARPLYVGKAESSLRSRDLRHHFADGRTGSSTLRRSLAALLHDDLELRGVPRNIAKPGYFANHGLVPDDDAALTAWMRRNLRIAAWVSDDVVGLASLETQVSSRLLPPLNLQGVTTPWSALVSARRAVLAAEAAAWRPSGSS